MQGRGPPVEVGNAAFMDNIEEDGEDEELAKIMVCPPPV